MHHQSFHSRGKVSAPVLAASIAAFAIVVVLIVLLLPKGGGNPSAPVATPDVSSTIERPAPPPARTTVVADSPAQTPAPEATPSPEPETTPAVVAATPAPVREDADMLRVYGTLTDELTGNPISGGRIFFPDGNAFEAMQGRMAALVETQSASDGKWELLVPRRGYRPEGMPMQGGAVVSLHSSATGYAAQFHANYIESLANLEYQIDLKLAPGGTISGRVVTSDGQGIGGAEVGWPLLGAIVGSMRIDMASSTTKADASGYFVLEGLPAGQSYMIPARADGYVPGATTAAVAVGSSDAQITLSRATGVIFGKVLNSSGAPAPGASVLVADTSGMGPNMQAFQMGQRMRPAKTDQNGAFRIDSLGAGSYQVMATLADVANAMFMMGGASVTEQVELADGAELEVTLQLPGESRLKGRVIDEETGNGVAGIAISPSYIQPGAGRPEGAVLSDADGRFDLPIQTGPSSWTMIYLQIPEGWVHVPDQEWGQRNTIQLQPTASETREDITVKVRRGILVRGIVLGRDGVTPVVGARPTVGQLGGSNQIDRPTDATGNFRFHALPNTDYTISLSSADGFAMETVMVATESPDVVTLVLKEYAAVSGYVRDSEGNPVAGVRVSLMYPTHIVGGQVRVSQSIGNAPTSAENGYYAIDNVPPLAPREVTVQVTSDSVPEGYSQPKSLTLRLEPGQYYREADLVLGEGLSLDGVVVDQNDQPIPGASINVNSWSGGFYRHGIVTNENGEFSISGVSEGQAYNVYAQKEGYIFQHTGRITVEDSPLVLRMVKSGAMTLRVVDSATRQPVEHFVYKVSGGGPNARYDGNPGTAVRSPDGVRTLTSVTPGSTITVHVVDVVGGNQLGSRRGVGQATVPAEGESGEVEVLLEETLSISGRVVARNEQGAWVPAAGVDVNARPDVQNFWTNSYAQHGIPTWQRDAFSPPRMRTGPNGEFTLTGLESGPMKVTAIRADPVASGVATVELAPGRHATGVEVQLASEARITGRVIDRQGVPMANVQLSKHYWRQGEPYHEPTTLRTDANGAFIIESALPGQHSFSVNYGDYHGSASVMIAEEQTEAIVELNFHGAIYLTGAMTLNGRPWPSDEHPHLQAESGARMIGFMHRDGRYTAWVLPGKYVLMVYRHPQGQIRLGEVEVLPTPENQTHDFIISQAVASIALVFPRSDDFEEGGVTFSREGGAEGPLAGLANVQMTTELRRVTGIPIERIRATFRSTSGRWQGMSDWVDVTAEADNIFIIDLMSREPVRIGSWSQATISGEYAPITFDVTPHITASGSWEVYFDYEGGNEGLMIESVTLLANGAAVSSDRHPGWSGYSRRDHIYVVDVGEAVPGVRYTISASVRAGSDQNSTGGVWLRPR